jgi:N-acetylglucosaminyl-diphospho-decaprenol L-rhamnosyltransferase
MPGIVVVTYNSAEVIGRCLDACLRVAGASVIVVDNASTDGTPEIVSRRSGVRLIANPVNRGFAGAVNQGFAALETEAVLILNPDAEPLSGVAALEEAVLREGAGAATGRLIGSDGRDQTGFNVRGLPTAWTLGFEVLALNRIWPGNPVNRRYRVPVPQSGDDIEQPAGAFLMVRHSGWSAIGGFDERFFPIWFEDVDFCKRLLDAGYRIVYVQEAMARHLGGHSASLLSWGDRQLFWYGSLLTYASKHLRVGSRRGVSLAVMLACVPRMFAGMPRFGISEPVFVYSKVLSLAAQCLLTGSNRRGVVGHKQAG